MKKELIAGDSGIDFVWRRPMTIQCIYLGPGVVPDELGTVCVCVCVDVDGGDGPMVSARNTYARQRESTDES